MKKGFPLKGHLTGHEHTHTGERIFQCKFCGKIFSVKGYLTGHECTYTRNCSISSRGYY